MERSLTLTERTLRKVNSTMAQADSTTGRSPRRSAAATREHLLDEAHDLFYWNGIHAVGVDRVARDAGVAPTTLYRLFDSKDDLVAAYVARHAECYRGWFEQGLAAGGDDPADQILSLFTALAQQIVPDNCRGCLFQLALAEYPEDTHPAHRQAVAIKEWVRERFLRLTRSLSGVHDPEALADHLVLVLEGAYASTQSLGNQGPARRALELVRALLP